MEPPVALLLLLAPVARPAISRWSASSSEAGADGCASYALAMLADVGDVLSIRAFPRSHKKIGRLK